MSKKKILVVEDHHDVRENLAEILELAGYEVLTAPEGRTGVALAREHLPDLIVCDIMMPELDGYGVLYLLGKQADTAAIPFIFLTAKADQSDIREGMNKGADDYLTKPFDEMDLLQAVEGRLQRSAALRSIQEENNDDWQPLVDFARGQKALDEKVEEQSERTYRRKAMVYLEGDFPSKLFKVKSGRVKTYRMNESGKELITGIYGPGEYFGYLALLQETPYVDAATAMEDLELQILPRHNFLELLHDNRDVSANFIKLLAGNVDESEDKLLHLAYDTLRKRVSLGLLTYIDKYGPEACAKGITLSREDLAKLVGTASESAIRTLSDFKQEGLIQIDGRKVSIPDAEALRNLKF